METAIELVQKLKSSKRILMNNGHIPKKNDVPLLQEKEIPFEIPSNWVWERLSNVSLIQEGPGIRKHQYSENGIQFLTVTNILDGSLDMMKSQKYIPLQEFEEKYSHFLINKGDIVSSCSGATWGKTALFNIDDKIMLNTSTLRLRFFNDLADNKYLYYITKSDFFKNQLKTHQTGQQPNYGFFHYSLIAIPIPTLEEQRSIVAKLDQAFAALDQAKANIEKNIANAKELFQSKLNQIFYQNGDGWEEKRIKEFGKVQTGTTPPTKDKDNYGEFIPFIKPAHFNSDGSLTPLDSYLSEKGIKKSRLIEANSVLMVCIGATIGKTGFTEIDVTCNQQINTVTPSKYYNYKFIYFGLISRIFQDEVLENGKGAQATLPIINKSKWENLFLNVNTNKNIQQQIVSQLDQLQEQTNLLVTKYQQKLDNLEELKKSILEKAFKGELTTQKIEV